MNRSRSPQFAWKASMSVGVPEFDDDHRGFIDAVDAIVTALDAHDPQVAERRCVALIAALRDHAVRETEFLRRNGFPDLDLIVGTHSWTQERFTNLLDEIRQGSASARATAAELGDTLINYLLKGDANFRGFVEHLGDRMVPLPPLRR
ncbi:MAG: bacteriohemerythrin [Actinomycetota bacterium]